MIPEEEEILMCGVVGQKSLEEVDHSLLSPFMMKRMQETLNKLFYSL